MSSTKFFGELFQRKYFYSIISQELKKTVLNILRMLTVNTHNKDSTLDSDGQTNAGSEDNYTCLL